MALNNKNEKMTEAGARFACYSVLANPAETVHAHSMPTKLF